MKLHQSMYACCCNRIKFEVELRARASGHVGVQCSRFFFFTETSVILTRTFVSLYCWSWYSWWPSMVASGS